MVWLILLAIAVGVIWLIADRASDEPQLSTREGPPSEGQVADVAAEDDGQASPKTPTLEAAGDVPPADRPQKHSLQGRVVDEATGLGIEGVRLHYVARRVGHKAEAEADGRVSDARGAFSTNSLTPGTWLIVPFHKDYTNSFLVALFRDVYSESDSWRHSKDGAWKEARKRGLVFDVPENAAPPTTIELRLMRGASVRGRVLGPDGAVVKGAPIHVHVPYYSPWTQVGGPIQHTVRTLVITRADEAGRFSLSCFSGELKAIRLGTSDGRLIGKWSEPLDLASGEEVELQLFEPAVIEGSVRWSDGRPEPGAAVWVRASELWILASDTTDELHSKPETAWTDEHGHFRLDRVPPASVTVRANAAKGHEGRASQSAANLRPRETRRRVVLTLNDQQWIQGVLVSPQGIPLEDEYVSAWRSKDYEDSLDGDWTDDEGHFVLEIKTKDPIELRLQTSDRDELLKEDLRAPIEGLRVVARQTPYRTVTVRAVAPDGTAIPRFEVKGGPSTSLTQASEDAEDGAATIKMQGSPPYYVRVSDPRDANGKRLPYAACGRELATGPQDEIEIVLRTTAEFYGRILDLEDKPVPGIKLVINAGSGERDIPVAADGRYRFTAKDPATREIRGGRLVLPEGYRDWTYVLTLHAGTYRDIRVRGGGLPIKGRVILRGAGSASLDDLGIQLSWTSKEGDEDPQISTDPEGRFVLYALPEDAEVTLNVHRYSLTERGLVALNGPVVVPAGTTDIVLEVGLGATIAGRVEGPGLANLDYRKLRACVLPWHGYVRRRYVQTPPTADSNAFEIVGLPEGRHRVALIDRQGSDRLLAWVDDVRTGRGDVVLRLPHLSGTIQGTIALKGLKDVGTIEVGSIGVRVWHRDGSNFVSAGKASEGGRFRVDRLDPDGRYALEVAVQAGAVLMVATLPNVKPGQPVHLALKPALSIHGRVERVRVGEGREVTRVVAVLATKDGISYFADFDEKAGAFAFSGLVEGEYVLTLLGPDLVRGKSVGGVRAGARDIVIHNR